MASLEIPDFNSKDLWRRARLLLWSLIVTVAVLDFANLITIPEYFAGFTLLTYVAAGWVLVYHAIEAMKKR